MSDMEQHFGQSHEQSSNGRVSSLENVVATNGTRPAVSSDEIDSLLSFLPRGIADEQSGESVGADFANPKFLEGIGILGNISIADKKSDLNYARELVYPGDADSEQVVAGYIGEWHPLHQTDWINGKKRQVVLFVSDDRRMVALDSIYSQEHPAKQEDVDITIYYSRASNNEPFKIIAIRNKRTIRVEDDTLVEDNLLDFKMESIIKSMASSLINEKHSDIHKAEQAKKNEFLSMATERIRHIKEQLGLTGALNSDFYQDANINGKSREQESLDEVDALLQDLDQAIDGSVKEIKEWDTERKRLEARQTTDAFTLEALAKDENPLIRTLAFCNPNMPSEQLQKMGRGDNQWFQMLAANNASTPSEVLDELAASQISDIRQGVIQNPSTSPVTLHKIQN